MFKTLSGYKIIAIAVWLICISFWLIELNSLKNYVPFCDDFGAILSFLINWEERASFGLLFEKYQEGRVFLSRLLIALYASVHGFPVKFSHITMMIWTAPIVLSLIFVGVLKEKSARSWEFSLMLGLPIAIMIFQVSVFGLYLWPQSGLTHGFLVPLGLLCLWLIEKKYRLLSVLLLLLSLVSAGGGILLLIVWLYFCRKLNCVVPGCTAVKKIENQRFVIWQPVLAVTLIACALILFSSVIFGEQNSVQSFLLHLPNIGFVGNFFLAFLGSYFTFNSPELAGYLGLFTLSIWFFITHCWVQAEEVQKLRLVKSYGYFILLIAAATAVLRSTDGALIDAVTTRYHYYSLTFFVITYIALLIRSKRRAIQLSLIHI